MTLAPRDIAFAGVSGLDDRMRVLAWTIQRGAMDAFSHEWTLETVRQCPVRDDRAEVAAVFERLKARVRYTFHPDGTDRFQTLPATWRLAAGDCDNATVALCTALHILGFRTGARIVSSTGAAWEHVYALVLLPRGGASGAWMPLDLTVGLDGTPSSARPGYEVPLRSMRFHRDFHFDLTGESAR
jgi:hypothetical protein